MRLYAPGRGKSAKCNSEITESVLLNYENINVIVEKLKYCGVRIALDDLNGVFILHRAEI